MFTVNYYLLSYLSSSLFDEGDEDVDWYGAIDDVKKIIKDYAVPSFVGDNLGLNMPSRPPYPDIDIHASFPHKLIYKINLMYFLTTEKAPFADLIAGGHPPFEPLDNPIFFFKWYWEIWFPGESYHLQCLDNIVEKNVPGYYNFDRALNDIGLLKNYI